MVGERGEFGGVAAQPRALISRAARSASSNWGRTRTRVLIFSLKILSLGMPCLLSASSWESSSCPSVEHRA